MMSPPSEIGSLQQAAVQAYGARLSMKKSDNYNSAQLDTEDFLESQRKMFNSTRNKNQFGISRTQA